MRIKYYSVTLSQLTLEMGLEGNSKVARVSFPALGANFATASERFWRGVKTTLKASDTMLHYFEGHEILARAVLVYGDLRVMLCVEERDSEAGTSFKLMGVSKYSDFNFSIEEAIRWLGKDASQAAYCDGVLTTQASLGKEGFSRADATACLYEIALSIDGVGRNKTSVVVSIDDWRLVLTSAFFVSGITIEDGVKKASSHAKALVGGRSVSAHMVAERRMLDAAKSCASLNECSRAMILLERLGLDALAFDEAMGHPFEAYGLASVSALPAMRMGKLPVNRTVREMLAAIARITHSEPFPVRERVGRFAASLIESIYDFEGMSFDEVMNFEEPVQVTEATDEAKTKKRKPRQSRKVAGKTRFEETESNGSE